MTCRAPNNNVYRKAALMELLNLKKKLTLIAILISLLMISSSLAIAFGQMQGNKTCEACGMTAMADAPAQFKIKDANGTMHYAECLMCAFKLLKTYDQLNITTFCDWYGPNGTITIVAKDHGETVTCNGTTALFMNGGGCTKTRVAFNQTAAIALLANGYSNFTSTMLRTSLPGNTTIMTIPQAAKLYGGGITSPDPSPSPSPSTQQCEACGMNVASDTQAHFKIVDGTGTTHYACCIKCAIKLLTQNDQLNITTSCDWYGPNFPITISVKNDLSGLTVNPSTAMIIDGSCAKNRVVYDQSAANALLANNGSSRYLVSSQNTTIPSNATVMSLEQGVRTFGVSATPSPSPSPTASPSPTPAQPKHHTQPRIHHPLQKSPPLLKPHKTQQSPLNQH